MVEFYLLVGVAAIIFLLGAIFLSYWLRGFRKRDETSIRESRAALVSIVAYGLAGISFMVLLFINVPASPFYGGHSVVADAVSYAFLAVALVAIGCLFYIERAHRKVEQSRRHDQEIADTFFEDDGHSTDPPDEKQ